MEYQLNKKISELVPYEPTSGTYRIRLDANECPINLSDEVMSEIKNAMTDIDFNRYPDALATEIVNAFSDFYNINPKYVTAGNGSDELISLTETAFLEKGDKMLVCSPDFSMYQFYSSVCEVICESLIKDDTLQIDVDALIKKINDENIKLVIFSNPCNPTGQGLTREEARKIVNSVSALVILDEAYMDFWSESLIDEVQNYSNLIVFRTASKAVGCAALRLGFAVANEKISRAYKAIKSPYNVNSFSQKAGSIVYKNKELLKNQTEMIVRNTETLYNSLCKVFCDKDKYTVYKTCANFVLIKTDKAKEIYDYLKTKSIIIRFMGEYIRISCGTEQQNITLVDVLKRYMEGEV